MTELIYKIVPRQDWEESLPDGAFQGTPDDVRDGFLHFSTKEQLPSTIEKFFADQQDLLVVTVKTRLVSSALRWEPDGDQDAFPHLYGSLPIEAVVSVDPLNGSGLA